MRGRITRKVVNFAAIAGNIAAARVPKMAKARQNRRFPGISAANSYFAA
jgi:hypothetical protein